MQGRNLRAGGRPANIFNAADGNICRKDARLGGWEQALVYAGTYRLIDSIPGISSSWRRRRGRARPSAVK